AMWQLNLARNWAEFRAAAAHFQAPAQNLLYADAKGHIGYQAPGHIPLRNSGDGWLPVAGWDGVHDWQGTVPFADLPRVLDPAEGFLVSANNRVAAGAYPFLTRDWDTGFRARRIVALLQGQRQLTRADMVRMQADAHNAMAALLVPRLLALKPAFTTLREREALALLRGWDYQDRADSAGAALFATFWAQLLLNTFADQVPTGIDGGNRWYEVVRRLLPEPDSDWWDNVDTPEREGGDDQLVHAFRTALAALTARLGDDPSAWRWERLHTVTFRHGTLGRSGIGPVERLFNLKPVGVGGNGAAINATGWHIGNPAVNWLPSLRMVVTPGDWEQSVAILTTGQSGHAFHPHYADMLPLWAAHRQARMAPPVTKGAVLRLLPDTDSIARKAQ
ncbi:MAG: penicillin acylase family protein, partial [Thiothrix sp.]|nr:penicillin acylase family protein [Thiothrix sp.]